MKTLLDHIVLKQLKTAERQILQNPFDIGSIQQISSENKCLSDMRLSFIFRDNINLNRYYTEFTIKIIPPRIPVF